MPRIIPLGERVLLKPVKGEEKTKSGIYLPKSEDKKEGIVEEIGDLKNNQNLLKKGDRVMYSGYSNEEIEIEGQKFLIVEFKDIIAKLEN
ncbi:MAG: co-chaperone GroES [Candidatus Pacearchaeota archaeon]